MSVSTIETYARTIWESETNFRRLHFSGSAAVDSNQLSVLLAPSITTGTTISVAIGVEPIYAGDQSQHPVPHTTHWLLAQYAKPFGFHKPPFITLKNPLAFRNIRLTTDTTFLKCSSAFTYHYPFSVCKGCAGMVYLTWITSILTRVNQYPAFACHVIPLTWFNIDSILLRTCRMPGRLL